ncbi:hypothetical protein DLM46_17040 [Paraburkholderia lacunae]|uniref:Uncharacterized protein n=1 Tax=Paraburkholderia lacunae TaxID=2211104 RepID=A0A370N7D6_9BURK|nr:hypothetical protein DLM46_17040 [Paraburkholderia lacunae]
MQWRDAPTQHSGLPQGFAVVGLVLGTTLGLALALALVLVLGSVVLTDTTSPHFNRINPAAAAARGAIPYQLFFAAGALKISHRGSLSCSDEAA